MTRVLDGLSEKHDIDEEDRAGAPRLCFTCGPWLVFSCDGESS